ncbi:tRNA (adenine(22)-N(1))-methyltransferase TrmK [Deinococcus humi]|uniref:tRNA (Adenine22-N1)-methyltransferase n=1 Tax=Deinococcus humi TaxID=662880 RepID=A0A7W8K0X1_9DEIO|nr:tRNA (adenine(22)-N(1))-methyltransferase TrmK [Deinococcus humi]MBB5365553.1 tRNA (adenine22-N1)-methyltransferase [Deinococcus humi]GGO36626.1 tRNA (adenine-N(1))-methyltransferase [Deinococcus humi]
MTMPTLDARLEAVLGLICTDVHADIGSDHARLPVRLVREGRVRRCIAVELNPGPLEQARRSVARSRLEAQIEVREGDGFGPILPGEVGSASLCGMGAHTIRRILERAGERLPSVLIVQPNDSALLLRLWAWAAGYHVCAEHLIVGYWPYPVLRLDRASGPDPAYEGLSLDAALKYGPLLLRAGGEALVQQIRDDIVRLQKVAAPGRESWQELETAKTALAATSSGIK